MPKQNSTTSPRLSVRSYHANTQKYTAYEDMFIEEIHRSELATDSQLLVYAAHLSNYL